MKKLIFLVAPLLFLSCFEPEKNCKDFHTGTFEFQSYLNGEMVTSRFIRTDSLEIDTFQGKTDTSSIRWINDCEYVIKNLHPKNRKERQAIHIRIIKTDKKGYTFEYGKVGDPRKERGSVYKVQE